MLIVKENNSLTKLTNLDDFMFISPLVVCYSGNINPIHLISISFPKN